MVPAAIIGSYFGQNIKIKLLPKTIELLFVIVLIGLIILNLITIANQ